MEYTYKGKNYPKEISLYNPEIKDILLKPKNDITLGEAYHILDLAIDTGRIDCERLILWEIGKQWGKNIEQLKADIEVSLYLINNALIFLMQVNHPDTTLPALLEILSQSDDFLSYNQIDPSDENWPPMHLALYDVCEANPQRLQEFLLRKGVTAKGKEIAAQALKIIGSCIRTEGLKNEIHADMVRVIKKVLDAYIADHGEYEISNKTLLSNVIDAAVCSGLKELYDEIMPLYRKGWGDEEICNEEDAYDGLTDGGWLGEPPSTKSRDWLLPQPKGYYWELEDTSEAYPKKAVQAT